MRIVLPLVLLGACSEASKPAVEGAGIDDCFDLVDNDDDGLIDCDDPGCIAGVACSDDSDTPPGDTGPWYSGAGLESWTLEGTATVASGGYDGVTTMTDTVVDNAAGYYEIGDILCLYHWPVTGVAIDSCEDCDFAFALDHTYAELEIDEPACSFWYDANLWDGSALDNWIGRFGVRGEVVYYALDLGDDTGTTETWLPLADASAQLADGTLTWRFDGGEFYYYY